VLRPANGTDYLVGDSAVGGNVKAVVLGSDGSTPQEADYQNGFRLLDPLRDINIVAVPGIGSTNMVSFGANYCQQRGDCFFVGDMSATDDTKEEAQDFIKDVTVKSSYAAVYFPWVKATDPTGLSTEPIALPPSGYVAGMYARIDARRGVWKAPAGSEANLGGTVGLLKDISDAEQDTLNRIGANAIRSFPASGIVIWGARTLATLSDPEYRYVPVRRTALFLEQSIYNGIQWAVFEPNDESLWSSLRLNIGAFMMLQFRAGAFQGKSASEAFFVRCDSKTTTQADIDAGVVNILVGFAPLKPAEFVVLKLTQMTSQSS
jgi:Bacteriophage tail sheath protein